jgi:hypothetical protein
MGRLGLGWALMVNSFGDVAISLTGGISFPPDPLDQGVTAALDPTEGVYCWVLSARFASISRQGIVQKSGADRACDKELTANSQ